MNINLNRCALKSLADGCCCSMVDRCCSDEHSVGIGLADCESFGPENCIRFEMEMLLSGCEKYQDKEVACGKFLSRIEKQ